jgi:BMFP domain-containing protein YqiC
MIATTSFMHRPRQARADGGATAPLCLPRGGLSPDVGKCLHIPVEQADGDRRYPLPTLCPDEFEAPSMMERLDIDQIALRLASLVPPGLADAQKDLRANFRDVLAQGLRRLELVTREEFDVQSQLLARTRARVEELERRVAELEAGVSSHGP